MSSMSSHVKSGDQPPTSSTRSRRQIWKAPAAHSMKLCRAHGIRLLKNERRYSSVWKAKIGRVSGPVNRMPSSSDRAGSRAISKKLVSPTMCAGSLTISRIARERAVRVKTMSASTAQT